MHALLSDPVRTLADVIRNTLTEMLSARQVPLDGLDRVWAQVMKLGRPKG